MVQGLTKRHPSMRIVVYSHSNEIPYKFAVDVKESQDMLPTMYW